MLDDLDNRRRLEPGQPFVPVHQRAVQEPNAIFLPRRQVIQPEPILGDLQHPHGHVHADDLLELLFLEEFPEQFALPAAEVQNSLRPRRLQDRHDLPKPLFIELRIARQGIAHGLDLVTERSGRRRDKGLAATARKHFERGDQRNRRSGQFGAFLGPTIQSGPSTWAIATLMNEDAT